MCKLLSLLICILVASNSCQAQLRELSRGDVDAKWKEAQLSLLNSQLAAQADGPLREELQAQAKWLKSWEPNSLKTKSSWESNFGEQVASEPILDPNRITAKLRQRLLGKDAKPTVADTKQLEALLAKYPQDIGVRQLHMHWLDQLQYRKKYADDIASVCDKLIELLDATPNSKASKTVQRAKAFSLYRKGRALAYRELPDVVAENPIEDPRAHGSRLQATYRQLTELAGFGRPEFVLLDIRMLRRDNWNGRALALLEEYGSIITPKWYLKKRRDLLTELGWEKPAEEAAAIYEAEFPEAVALEKKTSQLNR